MKNKGYFDIAAKKNKKKSYKISITVIAIIAVFIPTITAIINYAIKSNNTVLPERSMQVLLYREDKLLYDETDDPISAADTSLVSIFNSITSGMTSLDSVPKDLDTSSALRAVITKSGVSSEYKCYFSIDENLCYIVDTANNAYSISPKDAISFMSSPYSQVLYKNAIPPKLYTTSGDVITPSSVKWKYQNISKGFSDASGIKTESSEITYDMAGSLGITFDTEPDTCSVTVKKSGIPIPDVSYENLALTTVEVGTTLQFDVTAVWEQKENIDFHGTLSYKFKVLVRDRAEFVIDKTNLSAGDLAVISCSNIFDIEKINFSSKPSIDYEPVFFEDGDMVYTLIPFKNELKAGIYTFTFTYGATKQTIAINLSECPLSQSIQTKDENKEIFLKYTSNTSTNELYNLIRSLSSESYTHIFANGTFIDLVQNGFSVLYNYGTVFENAKSPSSHKINGTMYRSSSGNGATVPALNSGSVIYRGNCQYLGDFIVIEHGLGLRTVYGHLSAINVNQGDVVLKGESIGRTGKINEAADEGVFIMCYVFETPINCEHLLGESLDLYVPTKDNTK